MKRAFIIAGTVSTLLFGATSCDELADVAEAVLSTDESKPGLTNGEVISGLKSALEVGATNAAGLTSKEGGFMNNARIKLPFPEDAMHMHDFLMDKVPNIAGPQIDKFVAKMNEAASNATATAAPIFVNAIKGMSVEDGFTILKGEDDAATNFLREKTTPQLITAFSPEVGKAMDGVNLAKYWEPLTTKYNQLTQGTLGSLGAIATGNEQPKPVETDLNKYITEKAVGGLFTMVADEEAKIRKDPIARVNDILKKVFGSLDKEE